MNYYFTNFIGLIIVKYVIVTYGYFGFVSTSVYISNLKFYMFKLYLFTIEFLSLL